MRFILIAVVLMIGSYAAAQVQGAGEVKMRKPKDVRSSAAPVTHAEANAVFAKAWQSLVTGLKVKGANPVKMAMNQAPVTKNEILAAFKSMVTQVQPMFKRSASPARYKPERLRRDLDQANYAKLIRDGFVMPVGPLVVGRDGTVSTHEFGDSVGVMLIRIADLIHMPSRRFSPDIMGGKGG